MNKLKTGPNFTVFLLFFGIALLDAISDGKWIITLVWLFVGVFFLLADNLKHKT